MGYNLKMPWDLSESNREGFPVVGSSSFGAHKTAKDCFVDLKLGRLGDPGEGLVDKFEVPQASPMDPRSSRKARVRAQVASCLVDGCRSDLSTCRDYHRRHKVCEVHSKTAVVTIGGHQRRFCQQCSRFHSLAEFDEGKRSCRKRLDGHNRRRRKPQPQSRTLNPGKYLSNHQGARYFPFTNPQACATRSPLSSVWAGLVKAENDPILYNNSHSHSPVSLADRKNTLFAGALSHGGCEGGKQISFLQGTTSSLPGDYALGEAFPDPHCTGDQKMFMDGLNRVIASDCALSLLSSPPSKTQEFGFDTHPMISSPGYNLRPQVESAAGNVMDSGSGPGGNLHSPVMFRSGIDGSSAGMSHPTLFFSWE